MPPQFQLAFFMWLPLKATEEGKLLALSLFTTLVTGFHTFFRIMGGIVSWARQRNSHETTPFVIETILLTTLKRLIYIS